MYLYPIRLEATLHETIWGGRGLERDAWKLLPGNNVAIGEAWETEVSTPVQNGPYAGQTLRTLVDQLGPSLLGEQAIAIFDNRFPLLAKFIDANAQLSVQVHPGDRYAAEHEGGKLGKTEFWYILAAEPGASIVHGFKAKTTRAEVQQAIEQVTLENLLHEEPVQAGDVVFVPAGTVHAIGSGVLLYELQEYSDVTYRMYDYGRLTAAGVPRELHVAQSLNVTNYEVSRQVKMHPVVVADEPGYRDRCLVACRYFVTRELSLEEKGTFHSATSGSCIILSALTGKVRVHSGEAPGGEETLARGQTMVLPAALGEYRISGAGTLLFSYVPAGTDAAWQLWKTRNQVTAEE